MGDTALKSVQVERIYLKTRMVKKYCSGAQAGMWMLEAINLRHIEDGEGENFVDFYTRFVTDSLYQSEHIANPLQFVTIDPDDEFAILETTRREPVVCFPSVAARRQVVQHQLRTEERG